MPAGIWLVLLCAAGWRAAPLHALRPAPVRNRFQRAHRASVRCGSRAHQGPVYTHRRRFAGVAGVLQFSRLSVGDPTVADGLELGVIAAVIIGGGARGRARHGLRDPAGRHHHGGDSDRLRPEWISELDSGDRHRRDHRARRGAGSVEARKEAGEDLDLEARPAVSRPTRAALAPTRCIRIPITPPPTSF